MKKVHGKKTRLVDWLILKAIRLEKKYYICYKRPASLGQKKSLLKTLPQYKQCYLNSFRFFPSVKLSSIQTLNQKNITDQACSRQRQASLSAIMETFQAPPEHHSTRGALNEAPIIPRGASLSRVILFSLADVLILMMTRKKTEKNPLQLMN